MIYIKFYKEIKLEMIKHCMKVPSKECGGFLYGNIMKKNEDIFCEVDRNQLQPYFGANMITMIYSPAYSKLVGEYLDLNDESKKTKIITR